MNEMAGPVDPANVLAAVTHELEALFGPELLGLYLHGSWVTGDFCVERSDLDLLAVISAEPTDETVKLLDALHGRIAERYPSWAGRIEAEYITPAALSTFRFDPGWMVRISPGESVHRTRATRHYLLNWYVARHQGVALVGPSPASLLPDIDDAEFRQAVAEHAAAWPEWVTAMRTSGAQAYAVLTMCRALQSSVTGRQTTKRTAAAAGMETMPQYADLIGWAERWWYAGGVEGEPDRGDQVVEFVGTLARVIADRRPPQQ